MSYDPATDFLGLLRLTAGGVRSERMPGLDYVIAALARTGLITLSVGAAPPVANQARTVWLRPASPSWAAEGVTYLWNAATGAYQQATPALWSVLLAGVLPGDDDPLMNGLVAPGVSAFYSREDHVHPTDTSRAPLDSPVFLNNPRAPTQALGNSSSLIATTEFVIINGGLPPPIGSVLPYAGSVSPSANWQIATGQAFSRTGTTANLFAALGIVFGSGDGVTTFNGPDLRGRAVAGVDGGVNRLTTATMTSQALGGTGGVQLVGIAQANLPSVNFAVTIPSGQGSHAHGANPGIPEYTGNQAGGGTGARILTTTVTDVATLPLMTGIATSGGSGAALGNVQPTIELNYIIRIS